MTLGNNCLPLYLLVILLSGTVAHEAIVGGEIVNSVHQIPYQVSVENDTRHHICGGGIIHNTFVMSAANCIVDDNSNDLIDSELYVVARSINLHRITLQSESREVWKVHLTPEYNGLNGNHNGDIAILQLHRGFLHPVRPHNPRWLLMPGIHHRNLAHSQAKIAGFGSSQANATSDGRLRQATTYILANKDCERTYPHLSIRVVQLICARMESRTLNTSLPFGVCQGDTGGLLVQGRHANAVVIGILVKPSPNCDEMNGRGQPAIYTRVSRYEMFIDEVLSLHANLGLIHTITFV